MADATTDADDFDYTGERKESGISSASTVVPDAHAGHADERDLSHPAHVPRNSSRRPWGSVDEVALPIFSSEPRTGNTKFAPGSSLPMLRRNTTISGSRPQRIHRAFPYQFDENDDSSSSSDEDSQTSPQQNKDETAEVQPSGASGKKRKRFQKESSNGPFSKFLILTDSFATKGRVRKHDGRLNISVKETEGTGYLARAINAGIKNRLYPFLKGNEENASAKQAAKQAAEGFHAVDEDNSQRPRLNIVIMVIGSRGDIQPFIKIGKILRNDYGHRVRIATHPAFKDVISKDAGLEFFSVGGNPSELMAFMVKNPGLIPSLDTVKTGEIGRRRQSMYEMFLGMWRACISATDDETDKTNTKPPFVADAIIANPPSFAHVHIAERLGVPLHMMFTFPYSPTTAFAHPLANIKHTNVDRAYTNFMSYPLVDLMTWQGLGDLINKFRVTTLGLEPVSTLWAPGQLYRLKVPYTYLWSPSLVPKPKDWGAEIDIAGFVFLDLASSFTPPPALVDFLKAGPPPVYIGFGSIVVDDPDRFTRLIFAAVQLAGVRALVSKGWGGLGGDALSVPQDVFLLDNTPHDWLFPQVAAVVHHGGAGTTAIGLKCARPTLIVPFFGDQPFWGDMVARAGAGAELCIPYKKLTAEMLADGIRKCLTPEARRNVQTIAESIAAEGDGALNAVRSFHRSLPVRGKNSVRCSILEDRAAVWHVKNTSLRFSALAAEILVEQGKIQWSDLTLFRCYDWNDFEGPGEPITGSGMAIYRTLVGTGKGVGMVPVRAAKVVKHRIHHEEKKRKLAHRRKKLLEANKELERISGERMSRSLEHGGPQEEAEEPRPSASQSTVVGSLQRTGTVISTLSTDPSENVVMELAEEAGLGLARSGEALYHGPLNLTLALAQGFHNAPRLYGDDTVRPPPRIDDLRSGFHAGRDEFLHGIYDGFTGLYKLPAKGAKENGILGFLEGFGMGIGGLVLKNIAGGFGLLAFPAMGIRKRLQQGRQPTAMLRKARMWQGVRELEALREIDRSRQRQQSVSGALGMDVEGHNTEETSSPEKSTAQRNDVDETIETDTTQEQPSHNEQTEAKEDGSSWIGGTDGQSLEQIKRKVDQDWQSVLEVIEAAEKHGHHSIISRIALKREAYKWRHAEPLDSAKTAKRALQAQKDGKDVADVLKSHKKDVEKANKPRSPALEGPEKPEMNGSLGSEARPKGKANGVAMGESERNRASTWAADFAIAGR